MIVYDPNQSLEICCAVAMLARARYNLNQTAWGDETDDAWSIIWMAKFNASQGEVAQDALTRNFGEPGFGSELFFELAGIHKW